LKYWVCFKIKGFPLLLELIGSKRFIYCLLPYLL
jgi:hypothetical protein